MEIREDGRDKQWNSSASSVNSSGKRKNMSRSELCDCRKDILCVKRIGTSYPEYSLDYYQSDIPQEEEEEGFDETGTSCSEDSMMAYFPHHFIDT